MRWSKSQRQPRAAGAVGDEPFDGEQHRGRRHIAMLRQHIAAGDERCRGQGHRSFHRIEDRAATGVDGQIAGRNIAE